MLEIDPGVFPRLVSLQISNYRVLRNVRLDHLTPLAAFVGANGSGKSTLLDVLSFLAECLTMGVRPASEARGGLGAMRSRGSQGRISFTVSYRERPGAPLMTYHLALDEEAGAPIVAEESLYREGSRFRLLDYKRGKGYAAAEDTATAQEQRVAEDFNAPDVLAASVLSRFARHRHIMVFFRFITDWYLAAVQVERVRLGSLSRTRTRLSASGDNLGTVIQYLQEQHPARLREIEALLTRWVPLLAHVGTAQGADGRLQVQLVDQPFAAPIQAAFASEGALKLLAYLTVLYGPDPPQLIGLEEPENFLHPRLLGELAEACRAASDRPQLLVTTHSPFFIDNLRPEEVWVLSRNAAGYTQVRRAADIAGIPEFMAHGARLGDLWMEGYFSPLDGQPELASSGPGGAV
jgi:predicted ATPase